MKIILSALLMMGFFIIETPEVKVVGALKNVMMKGDLSAYINLDTLDKANLYGLGPAEGLKGELLILNGQVLSSEKKENQIFSQKNKVSKAAMLVYSRVEKWRAFSIKATITDFAKLENMVESTAKANGYDTSIPFAFKIELTPQTADYHIIDWQVGATHTMANHKQFAFSGSIENKKVLLLGFYSDHHHSVFTHHTTNVHIHIMDIENQTIGHLDNVKASGIITLYLPEVK